jgi:predicted secreted hydrolase
MNARLFAILLTFAPIAAIAADYSWLGAAAPGFATPKPGAPILFPQDHAAHPAFRTEWWYLTANLTGDDGQSYGAQWTLFRYGLEAREGVGWDNRTAWMGHAAITSAGDHVFAQNMARGDVGQAGVITPPFHAFIDDWFFEARDSDFTTGRIHAQGPRFAYTLDLTRHGPFVLQGDKGYSLKAGDGLASHYYSQPFFTVDGDLTLNGKNVHVAGRAWMDREWSSQTMAPDQKGWDWFSLHLASGDRLMLFRLRGTRDYRSGNWIAPDGGVSQLASEDIVVEPLAHTVIDARELPTSWRVKVKSRKLDIVTTPLNPKSWIGADFPYWEGPIGLTGSTRGEGYLEMTGY